MHPWRKTHFIVMERRKKHLHVSNQISYQDHLHVSITWTNNSLERTNERKKIINWFRFVCRLANVWVNSAYHSRNASLLSKSLPDGGHGPKSQHPFGMCWLVLFVDMLIVTILSGRSMRSNQRHACFCYAK